MEKGLYGKNGISSAGKLTKDIRVRHVKPLANMMMILAFTSGERRLYDAAHLLELPPFLRDECVFKSVHCSMEG